MQWLNHLEQQMIWQLQETWALQVVFSSSILPRYGWLHVGYRLFFVGGGAYRFTWFGAVFNTTGPSLTKVVYAYFDRISHDIGRLHTLY